jgi:heme-degrading monooxygenase HmoA
MPSTTPSCASSVVGAPAGGRDVVLEVARISIAEGDEEPFELAMAEAKAVLAASPGFLGAELHRGIERPSEYWLLVRWETLESHTVEFRQSDRFVRWRQLIGPYFAAPPETVHAELKEVIQPKH